MSYYVSGLISSITNEISELVELGSGSYNPDFGYNRNYGLSGSGSRRSASGGFEGSGKSNSYKTNDYSLFSINKTPQKRKTLVSRVINMVGFSKKKLPYRGRLINPWGTPFKSSIQSSKQKKKFLFW